jgi:hypothetical protein
MKRLLLIAALCLFTTTSHASTFYISSAGQYDVVGDFAMTGSPYVSGVANMSLLTSVIPGNYDAYNGPFYGYNATVRVNDATLTGCYSIQIQSMCGRYIQPSIPTFTVSDLDGDGIGLLNVTANIQTFNETVNSFSLQIILPDGFELIDRNAAIAAVPESSTWAMMLLGFIGIGAVTYRRRNLTPVAARHSLDQM